MVLRATKPEAITKRLKLFMFGPSGVGKTTAAIQFPNSYIVDCERGTENYERLVTNSGSVVFKTTNMNEIIREVKSLLSEKHQYRTLVIDPITTAFNELLDKCEEQVGDAHGKHYGAAGKIMKRLANLLVQLDMNVVVTAHAKAEYGANFSKIGYTFDGWKQLDYFFDLVVELGKKGKKRFAKVVKTRIEQFPDEDVFEWSYEAIQKRYDLALLEREAAPVTLATPEQVRTVKDLLALVRLPEGTTEKWFAKEGVDLWEDMSAATLGRCIEYLKNRLPQPEAAEDGADETDPRTGTDPLASNDALQTAIDGAFMDRGISTAAAATATGKILAAYKVANLADLTLEQRHAVISRIQRGGADHYKTSGTPVAAQ